MNPVYRVEAFIMPILDRATKNNDNIIDDEKVANKLKSILETPPKTVCVNINNEQNNQDKQVDCAVSRETEEKIITSNISLNNYLSSRKVGVINSKKKVNKQDTTENITEVEVNTCSEEMSSNSSFSLLNVDKLKSVKFQQRFETNEYVVTKIIPRNVLKCEKALMRTNSLMSIDERGETPEDCNDEFCYHGYKNGCTTTQRPEAVTEEVFEINWMKRLEQLRTRESIIKEKEAVLFDRERLLFKKERELRILERLVKDKLKNAQLYLNQSKIKNEEIDCDPFNKISEQSKDSQLLNKIDIVEELSSSEILEFCDKIKTDININKNLNNELNVGEVLNSRGSLDAKVSVSSEKLKNPPNSMSSLVIENSKQYQPSSYLNRKHAIPLMSRYNSLRIKKRPKIVYDDLNSTLSADNGDSSFVVTSKKFEPEIFKKPYAFTRFSSERGHTKTIPQIQPSHLSTTHDTFHTEEQKLLKRISENMFITHDKHTKFQHYGSIDARAYKLCDRNIDNDNRRYSYLNLEDGKKNTRTRVNNTKNSSKERPSSWNVETNEWLQKKRQVYNLQTARKIPTEDIHNDKENHDSRFKLNQIQKKPSKGIKFNIFR